MKIKHIGLVKILTREFKGMYTKEKIENIIEEKGVNFFDRYGYSIKYLGFDEYEFLKSNK